MRHATAHSEQTHHPVSLQTVDTAVIRVDQLQALSGLLSIEEVAEQFAGLSMVAQASIFGLFEDGLADIREVLARASGHSKS
ncbi:hypothetical protein D0B32_17470 [Paraburkholderia sp. DHOC27]|nr:hypothetical protein D0B32_17470 [Paraburkholderia sp. DHOC27]